MRTLVCFCFLLLSLSAHAGHVIGNGGGGIVTRNGVTTIHASGLETLRPLTIIPGLKILTSELDKFLLSGNQKTFFVETFLPNSNRRFYQLPTEHIDADDLLEVKKEYADFLKVEVSQVVIFALTDAETRSTYLLDAFFQLSEQQQAVLLFHEGLWLFSEQFDLAGVVEIERKFEEVVQTQNPRLRFDLVFELGSRIGLPFSALRLAVKDLMGRSLPTVFPKEFFTCLSENSFLGASASTLCEQAWRDWMSLEAGESEALLIKLMRQAPLGAFWFHVKDLRGLNERDLAKCRISEVQTLANVNNVTLACADESSFQFKLTYLQR